MARLTAADYLRQRTRLELNWFVYGGDAFIELPSKQQRELHDYFAPSRDLTEDQALAHRKAATAQDPSLPQRAGRALRKIEPLLTEVGSSPAVVSKPTSKGKGPRNVRLKALLRPEIDIEKLARAFRMLAEHEEKQRIQDDKNNKAA